MLCGCRLISQGQNADGVRLFNHGSFQPALVRFQQAVATDPKNPDGYYNLAAAYHRLGNTSHLQQDWDQAESYYKQCTDHDPNHHDAHRGLAVLLVEQGRKDEAFRKLEEWASRYPTSATPKVELARLSEEYGDHSRAKEYLYDALGSDPYDARALAALGRLHEQQGNTAQALADYQRSLTHNRFQPEVAARVASIKSALNPPSVSTPPGGTRTVISTGPPRR